MNNPVFIIINTIVAGLLVLAGYGISFLQQKWKQKQTRKDAIFEKRMKVYGEGLEFIYEVEQNQVNVDELERILGEWKKWYPINAIYLPPTVNDTFFGAMYWTVLVIIDLHNRKTNEKTMQIFKERLQEAKTQLMNLRDIGWLPKDLR